ncbi:hypothetical protein PG990_009087 [Apiospora arundinis]
MSVGMTKRNLAHVLQEAAKNQILRAANIVSLAIEHDQGAVVQECFDLGVEIDTDNHRTNLLCIAANQQKENVVETLLKLKANYGLARRLLLEARWMYFPPLDRYEQWNRQSIRNAIELLTSTALRYYLAWMDDRGPGARLRDCFQQNYDVITERVCITAGNTTTSLAAGNSVYYEWGPMSSRRSVESAWDNSLAILRKACRGVLPRNAHDILLFTALTKAMSHEIDDKLGSSLEDQVLADLNRWNIVLKSNKEELAALRQAILNIWDVDIWRHTSSSDMNVALPERADFYNVFQHFQDLANTLTQTSWSVVATASPCDEQSAMPAPTRFPDCEFANGVQPHEQICPDSRPSPEPPIPTLLRPNFLFISESKTPYHTVTPGTDPGLEVTRCTIDAHQEHWRSVRNVVDLIVIGENPVACGKATFRFQTTTQSPVHLGAYIPLYHKRCAAAAVIERTYLLLSLLLGYLHPVSIGATGMNTPFDESSGGGSSGAASCSAESLVFSNQASEAQDTPVETHMPSPTRDDVAPSFDCGSCDRSFSKVGLLNRHTKEEHRKELHVCARCGRGFKRKDYRDHHQRKQPRTCVAGRLLVADARVAGGNGDAHPQAP